MATSAVSVAGFLWLRCYSDRCRGRDSCGRPTAAADYLTKSTWFRSRTPEFRQSSLRSGELLLAACTPSSSPPPTSVQLGKKLYVSGLSFRTTEESLRNAFEKFGELVQVNLVMDNIARRPRGFAFLYYSTEEASQRAIDGMHGKFLDGRVIFVEAAKSRWALRQERAQNHPRTVMPRSGITTRQQR
ncbi:hypothetical protein MLD38_028115 [Melastoma candidum]|uniref:Uncharacterized protein n=1 Tax=Melastoma candidum TaxID=119954 RepID=A0ACB9N054_9MYRT|nr:hypothetical protein MLD38_028115 [Melastoma candidum]